MDDSFGLSGQVQELVSIAVPAVIFLFVRSQFLSGRLPKAGDAAVNYVALTTAYYAFLLPIISFAYSLEGTAITWWMGWAVITLILPFILGIISGVAAQRAWIYKFLRRCGMNPIHTIPTAWEWKFAHAESCYVVVTLSHGRAFGAWYGENSFVSTNTQDKDVFLEETFDINDNGEWVSRGFAILINANDISTVEFELSGGDC